MVGIDESTELGMAAPNSFSVSIFFLSFFLSLFLSISLFLFFSFSLKNEIEASSELTCEENS